MSRRPLSAGLLVVGIIGAALLISELFLRFSLSSHEINGNYWARGAFSPHEAAGYIHHPGYEGRAIRQGVFDVEVRIDENGLRQSNLEAQLRYPRRVLLLGDSFAFGLGVAEEDSFASRIQADLNPVGIGVINGAQTGYGAEQETLLGLELIRKFEPDLVVTALFPLNDIEADFNRRHERVEVVGGYRLYRDRLLATPWVDWIRTNSVGWVLAERQLAQRRGRAGLEAFASAAKADRNTVIQPSLAAIDRLSEASNASQIEYGVVLIPPGSRGSPFDRPLMRSLRERNLPAVNLARMHFGSGHYFEGDGHWNERGHAKAATHFADFIKRLSRRGRASSGRHDRERRIEVVEQTE
ncbi:MAG: hypothetical protein P8R42_28120 [Candidatus Binatia bacterium]|nr:hypothetical protein [Candidatus Binatia bacterium]